MPAGSTYTPIATTTLANSTTNDVQFSSISSAYTDLVLVVSARNTTASTHSGIYLYFNSNASGIYSHTNLEGNGTTASSSRATSTLIFCGSTPAASAASNIFSSTRMNIQNYSNATTFKTVISRGDAPNATTTATVGLYPSTSAITTVNVATGGTGNFLTGSTFTLYGIASA
jgi:hypothetical protein